MISSNLDRISHRFRDMASSLLVLLPQYIQPLICKCFPCTR